MINYLTFAHMHVHTHAKRLPRGRRRRQAPPGPCRQRQGRCPGQRSRNPLASGRTGLSSPRPAHISVRIETAPIARPQHSQRPATRTPVRLTRAALPRWACLWVRCYDWIRRQQANASSPLPCPGVQRVDVPGAWMTMLARRTHPHTHTTAATTKTRTTTCPAWACACACARTSSLANQAQRLCHVMILLSASFILLNSSSEGVSSAVRTSRTRRNFRPPSTYLAIGRGVVGWGRGGQARHWGWSTSGQPGGRARQHGC